jgi:uncharacterized BrkB/YihY/UPF0761 family membrane protein
MSSAMSTLNQAYHVKEGRSWIRVRITAILLTVALAIFVLVSFALVLFGRASLGAGVRRSPASGRVANASARIAAGRSCLFSRLG